MVNRYEDLDAWQLADDVRREVIALTESGPAAKDFKFRDQIRDAISSAARNMAEGFGRFNPGDFAHFMDFAIASTMETKDLIGDGIQRGYFSVESTLRARKQLERCLHVSRALRRYLKERAQKERSAKRRA